MTTPELPPEHAVPLGRRYFAMQQQPAVFEELQERINGQTVCIVGTGRSAKDRKVTHDVVISLNGAHWMFTPEAFHVSMTRDWTEHTHDTMRLYPNGDEADRFVISDRAWTRERTPLERSFLFSEPMPVRRLGSQPLAAWFAASFGARELHFYGCDSVAGDPVNGYSGQFKTAKAHQSYLAHPGRVKHLIGGTPAVWHVGAREYTVDDIEEERPVVSRPWVASLQRLGPALICRV